MTSDVQHHPTIITTPSDTEIRIEREFDAPREMVWEVYTDPALIPEWLGPRDRQSEVLEYDVRPGGRYRYISRRDGADEFTFYGEFLEVVAPELLVSTFRWEGMNGPGSVDRAEFHEAGHERTLLVATATFGSREDRDGMIRAGMEGGVVASYERLDEILSRG
jgi:uncharacterized protein YndB with AHSA1/START domain